MVWSDSCPQPGQDEIPVLDAEWAVVAEARDVRRREFARGRQAARACLRRLGCADQALLPGPDRAPVWPDGIRGSIAHTGDHAVAVVGSARAWMGLGIDVEPDRGLEEELWAQLCVDAELAELQRAADPGRAALLRFAAKEAFYKAQYASTGRFLEFTDVCLEVDPATRVFRARPGPGPARAGVPAASGAWLEVAGLLYTFVAIPV